MGRLLFIRVSAVTYDVGKVSRTWPKLYALVWPDLCGKKEGSRVPVQTALGISERGVVELVLGLVDLARFGAMDADTQKSLEPLAEKFEALIRDMEKALGNRDAQIAFDLTNSIEDMLDEAEQHLA